MILSTTNTALEDSYKINENKDKVKEKLKQDLKNWKTQILRKVIESNNYEYHKMMHELKVYQIMFYVTLVCLVFPILYIFSWGPLSRVGAFIIWIIIMFFMFIYAFNELVYKAKIEMKKSLVNVILKNLQVQLLLK